MKTPRMLSLLLAIVVVSCARPSEALAAPPRPLESPGMAAVYLVPFAGFPAALVEDLVAYTRALGLDVQALPPAPIEPSASDGARHQLVAEELIAAMLRRHPQHAARPGPVVIGLTRGDMFARGKREWAFVFGWRQGEGFGVISSARLDPAALGEEADDEVLRARLRKVLLRYVGLLHYQLPLSDDRGSVLYRSLLGVDDLDLVGEAFAPPTLTDANATTSRTFVVRDHGSVVLALPDALRHAVSRPRGGPLVIRFAPRRGDRVDARLVISGRASHDPAYARRHDLRPLVEEIGQEYLSRASETTLTIHDVQGEQVTGHYFTLTARGAVHGRGRLTVAVARVGELLATLSVQYEDNDPTELRLLITMLAAARDRWDGTRAGVRP